MLQRDRVGWLTRAAVGLLIGSLIFGATLRRLILAAESATFGGPNGSEASCRQSPNSAGISHGFFRALRKVAREATAITAMSSTVLRPAWAGLDRRPDATVMGNLYRLSDSLQRLDVRLQV